MPNESEFETVISEADVEAGVMPIPQSNANAQKPDAPSAAPASSGWSLVSLSGLQYFDLNASELKERLMALCMPWKGMNLFDMVSKKPDLYMPLWMTFFTATVYCFLWIMFTGKPALPILHAAKATSALWGSSSFIGVPMGMIASVSYSSYITLLCEIPRLLFSWNVWLSLLFCFVCAGIPFYFCICKRLTDGNQTKSIVANILYAFFFAVVSQSMSP